MTSLYWPSWIAQNGLCAACGAPGLEVAQLQPHPFCAKVSCLVCAHWFRWEDGVLELLPPTLQNQDRLRSFAKRFDLPLFTAGEPSAGASQWDHKTSQRDFFNHQAHAYETQMLARGFWKAFDVLLLERAKAQLRTVGTPQLLLDVGCGGGRFSRPLLGGVERIVGVDLSEAMVRSAYESLSDSDRDRCFYFLADAEKIPLRAELADAAVLAGVLHHVAHPEIVLSETARLLRPGGTVVGTENHATPLRPVFDALMRLKRLWHEEAHEDHFAISGAELRGWMNAAGLAVDRLDTEVFIPPHLFEALPGGWSKLLLKRSNAFARALPGVGRLGGLLVYEGHRG